METDEFVVHAPLDAEVLEAWIEAGWLLPQQDGAKRNFFDVDLARAHLIHDLESIIHGILSWLYVVYFALFHG
jgi:chaperone modulatory protein CbpM